MERKKCINNISTLVYIIIALAYLSTFVWLNFDNLKQSNIIFSTEALLAFISLLVLLFFQFDKIEKRNTRKIVISTLYFMSYISYLLGFLLNKNLIYNIISSVVYLSTFISIFYILFGYFKTKIGSLSDYTITKKIKKAHNRLNKLTEKQLVEIIREMDKWLEDNLKKDNLFDMNDFFENYDKMYSLVLTKFFSTEITSGEKPDLALLKFGEKSVVGKILNFSATKKNKELFHYYFDLFYKLAIDLNKLNLKNDYKNHIEYLFLDAYENMAQINKEFSNYIIHTYGSFLNNFLNDDTDIKEVEFIFELWIKLTIQLEKYNFTLDFITLEVLWQVLLSKYKYFVKLDSNLPVNTAYIRFMMFLLNSFKDESRNKMTARKILRVMDVIDGYDDKVSFMMEMKSRLLNNENIYLAVIEQFFYDNKYVQGDAKYLESELMLYSELKNGHHYIGFENHFEFLQNNFESDKKHFNILLTRLSFSFCTNSDNTDVVLYYFNKYVMNKIEYVEHKFQKMLIFATHFYKFIISNSMSNTKDIQMQCLNKYSSLHNRIVDGLIKPRIPSKLTDDLIQKDTVFIKDVFIEANDESVLLACCDTVYRHKDRYLDTSKPIKYATRILLEIGYGSLERNHAQVVERVSNHLGWILMEHLQSASKNVNPSINNLIDEFKLYYIATCKYSNKQTSIFVGTAILITYVKLLMISNNPNYHKYLTKYNEAIKSITNGENYLLDSLFIRRKFVYNYFEGVSGSIIEAHINRFENLIKN